MKSLSFKRHSFPADVIRHAVWLYFRFSLSFRDVEELLAARGINVSYETIRCWTIKFGPDHQAFEAPPAAAVAAMASRRDGLFDWGQANVPLARGR